MRLIINADDFGMDNSTTKAILDSFSLGAITQTTMIVTGEGADEAAILARQHGVVDRIGFHLNLADGHPLTEDIKQYRLFCDASGAFNRELIKDFKRKESFDGGLKAAIEKEISAQIEKFLSYGFTLRHCDGHHHFEFITPISKVLMPLLRRYRFQTIRRKPWLPIHDLKPHIRTRLNLLPYVIRARVNGFHIVSGFAHWPEFLASANHLGKRVWIELMTHPRYIDNQLVNVVDFKHQSGIGVAEMKKRIHGIPHIFLTTYSELAKKS